MRTAAIQVGATNIRDLVTNASHQRLTAENIADALKRAPLRLRHLVKEIKIHDVPSPNNAFWAASTGQQGFEAFATADSGTMSIEFWANSPEIAVDPAVADLDYIVRHELGHLLDRKLGLRAAEKALRQHGRKQRRTGVIKKVPKGFRRHWWSEEGTSWSKAMMMDNLKHPGLHYQGYISQYAALHSQNREDFADSVAFLLRDPAAFAIRYPNRFKFLSKKLGMKGAN